VRRIELRRLRGADWRLYRELRLASLADAPYAFGSKLVDEQRFPDELWGRRLADAASFGAFLDGVPAGTATGLPPRFGDSANLVGVWVDPSARGHGLGGRLVEAVAGWAVGERFGEIRLWVAEGNRTAERLYALHGFRRTGAGQRIGSNDAGYEFEMNRLLVRPAVR
jgi:GNAT superfamily N-acetyltransferase